MRVIVGLGNPGHTYAETRHNVGFAVVEELAHRWRCVPWQNSATARHVAGHCGDELIMLAEPQMYMNRSGGALAALLPSMLATDLIVVHDDLDLEPGRIRVKQDGGTAGHHGLESIAAQVGEAFTRVRVGIGRPASKAQTVDFVLSKFTPGEIEIITTAIGVAADAVEWIVHDGVPSAMNRFNARARQRI